MLPPDGTCTGYERMQVQFQVIDSAGGAIGRPLQHHLQLLLLRLRLPAVASIPAASNSVRVIMLPTKTGCLPVPESRDAMKASTCRSGGTCESEMSISSSSARHG